MWIDICSIIDGKNVFFFAETGGVGMNLCPSAALIDDAKTLR